MWNHVCYPFVISFCYCILLSLIKYFFDIKSIYFRNDISSSKLILLLHQNVKIEKALSVVCSYFWFSLYTIKSILVNINFPHLYTVHYEDGNSKFHILRRHLFQDLNGFQSYSRTEKKHKITLEYIIIMIRIN